MLSANEPPRHHRTRGRKPRVPPKIRSTSTFSYEMAADSSVPVSPTSLTTPTGGSPGQACPPVLATLSALETEAWHRTSLNDETWLRTVYLYPDPAGHAGEPVGAAVFPRRGILPFSDALQALETRPRGPDDADRTRHHEFLGWKVVCSPGKEGAVLAYSVEWEWKDAGGNPVGGKGKADCSTVFVDRGGAGPHHEWRCVLHQRTDRE
ncbi:hypothetical protein DFJ74DRAFT_746119 [Hyaloraphidium curvatum]|nr:hypothetical protein DFJ74DRAFT_746119 [Hyaloraphidium curvatum]